MDELARQIRVAVRKLARAPLFTAIAGFTLAVGIGANAAIFSVVDAVLLRPLPYERPEELVSLWHEAPGLAVAQTELSQATYFTYRAESRTLRDVGVWDDFQASVTGLGEPERVDAMLVTDGTLPLLGATTAVGRLFGPADDVPGAPPIAMLGYAYWQRRLGGDPGVVGRTIQVNGRPYEIAGVTARGFRILDHDPSIYLPARFDPANAQFGNFSYRGIARMRPGVTPDEVRAELARLVPVALEQHPGPITQAQLDQAGFTPVVRPLKEDLVGDVSAMLWVLLGTVGLVLLLACANVANLFLVQAEMRQREVAVRTALGAGRGRLVGGFLIESLVLSALGGVAGLALAWGGLRLLVALGPERLPRLAEIGVDGRVLGFTLLVSAAAALLFGLFPALRYGRTDLHAVIKEGGRGAGPGRERHAARNALVVVQVALALVLLIGSGLMVRTVRALRDVDPGFADPDRVLAFTVSVPEAEMPDPARVAQFEQDLVGRLRALPGVEAAGAISVLTMTDELSNSNPIVVEGRPVDPARLPPVRSFRFVAPGYHEALRVRLLAGRMLTWADVESRALVVVVNEELARQEFGEPAAAVGQRVRDYLDQDWYEIVGVTASVRYAGVSHPAPAVLYWPIVVESLWELDLFVPRTLDYVLRTRGEPTALLPQVRQALAELNPSLPVARVRILQEVLDGSLARAAFAMVMLSIAAAVALALGLVGIYGVISYIVSQRTREIGVRIALGARPADVRGMVVRQAAGVVAIGLGAGLAAAAGLTRLMGGLLFGVRPLDLLTYATVTLAIAGVALLASWLPARRAARVDPVTALRAE